MGWGSAEWETWVGFTNACLVAAVPPLCSHFLCYEWTGRLHLYIYSRHSSCLWPCQTFENLGLGTQDCWVDGMIYSERPTMWVYCLSCENDIRKGDRNLMKTMINLSSISDIKDTNRFSFAIKSLIWIVTAVQKHIIKTAALLLAIQTTKNTTPFVCKQAAQQQMDLTRSQNKTLDDPVTSISMYSVINNSDPFCIFWMLRKSAPLSKLPHTSFQHVNLPFRIHDSFFQSSLELASIFYGQPASILTCLSKKNKRSCKTNVGALTWTKCCLSIPVLISINKPPSKYINKPYRSVSSQVKTDSETTTVSGSVSVDDQRGSEREREFYRPTHKKATPC